MAHAWKHHVDRFCRQYLQLEPALDFPPGELLRLGAVQQSIYRRLFADDALSHAPPDRYRLRTLKALVARIEAAIDDWDEHAVSDELMATLSALLSAPLPPEAASVQQRCYVTYALSLLSRGDEGGGGAVGQMTLLENRSLISAVGTTGFRTWEAALHLGQYLCENPSIVAGKRILELGAGTGYLSILCARHLGCAHAVASDGSRDVVASLPDNLLLNGLQGSGRASAMRMRWGQALAAADTEPRKGGQAVDVVLGADITYDRASMPALVGTLLDLWALHPRAEVYMAATRRNEQTFQAWTDACRARGLRVDYLAWSVPPRAQQHGPFYSDGVAVGVCRVGMQGVT